MLRETIEYYLSNGNREVHVCALDLSKAYDRVSHYRLFAKLFRRGVSVYFVKFLDNWYTAQEMQVKLRDSVSSPVAVRNGVRQRSVLSPCLFNVYIADLLKELYKCGEGERMSVIFLGCLAYADDITFASPTVKVLQRMLDICNDLTKDHALMFNINNKKSVSISFVKKKQAVLSNLELWLNGSILNSKQEVVHLGVVVDRSCVEEVSLAKRS